MKKFISQRVSIDAGQQLWTKSGPLRVGALKSAFIIISDKAPKVECTVRNISETGAGLQVSTNIGIPKSFDVIMTAHAAIVARCGGLTQRLE